MCGPKPLLKHPKRLSELPKAERRALSGAFGAPVTIPVHGMFCNCVTPHYYLQAKPGEEGPYFEEDCPR